MSVTVPDYVNLPFVTDPNALGDAAIVSLQATWPDWEPGDSDMESILIEALAPMAANVAAIAAQMPPAALQTAGTVLWGLPPNPALPAQTTMTFTARDSAGYTIAAGQQVSIDGWAFALASDVNIGAGETSVTGQLVIASTPGAGGNDLRGIVVEPYSLGLAITGYVVEAPTAGGADAEDPLAYLSRLSRAQRLRARTLVTPVDYEIEACEQPGIGRAHASPNVTTKTMTVTVADPNGLAVLPAIKTALAADFAVYVCANWTVALADPTYTKVSVTWAATAYPGYDATALAAQINGTLANVLSPAGYGALWGGASAGSWWNQPTIAVNRLIAIIGGVEGVMVCTSVLINGAAVDLAMAGAVPLPTAGAMTGVVTVA
jgi:Baseplate J-like protein